MGGKGARGVSRILAAFRKVPSTLGRSVRLVLPRSYRAWLGRQQLSPGHSRLVALVDIATCLLLSHKGDMAIACLRMFALSLRPAEPLGLQGSLLIPPATRLGGGHRLWSILPRPKGPGVPGRAAKLNETVYLDVPELPWLDPRPRVAPEQGLL